MNQQQRAARFGFNTHGNVIPVPNPSGRNITLIAAMDVKNGIGKNGVMPWAVSPDMKQFKRLTTGHAVIMGRKTFESLGCKPLPDRLNIVISRDGAYIEKFHELPNLKFGMTLVGAVQYAEDYYRNQDFITHGDVNRLPELPIQIFIIGGGEIYKQALQDNYVNDMILTRFNHDAQCDTFFPELQERFWLGHSYSSHFLSGGIKMRYEYWCRKQLE
jgi:dihydrofolate reductase